jgi:nitrite reductase/ring-hydroxylating ferredoxin subunit
MAELKNGASWIEIGPAAEIEERKRGLRFPVAERHGRPGSQMTGFVVRFEGQLYGYLNQCAHVPTELDWVEGEFFEGSGLYLMCATHGAIYLPENGRCAGGPCRGGKLRAIQIKVEDGLVYWQPDEYLIGPPDLLAPQ